ADIAEPHAQRAVVGSGAREPQHGVGAAVDDVRVGDHPVGERGGPALLERLDLVAALRGDVAAWSTYSPSEAATKVAKSRWLNKSTERRWLSALLMAKLLPGGPRTVAAE